MYNKNMKSDFSNPMKHLQERGKCKDGSVAKGSRIVKNGGMAKGGSMAKSCLSVLLLVLLLIAPMMLGIGVSFDFSQGISLDVDGIAKVYADTEAELDYITDQYGLLEDDEYEDLNALAKQLSEYYDFGVYTVLVDDYTKYGDGNIFDVATSIYKYYNLGHGEGKDGLMLMLSMYERDYVLITYGDFGNYAFNDDGRIAMTKYFLDDFGDDFWYGGIFDYLDTSRMYLEAAENGNPYSATNVLITEEERSDMIASDIAIILILPLIIAFIVIAILSTKMRSVAIATTAHAYAVGQLNLRNRRDTYTHSTETRTKIEKSGGSGGTTTHRSGGFSGTSGKF